MGRAEKAKAPHRRPVDASAAPSRGQRKRALKKASLLKKIGVAKRVQQEMPQEQLQVGVR